MATYPSSTHCLGGIGLLLILALGNHLASSQYLPSPRYPGPVAIPRPQRSLFGPGPPIGWSSGGGYGWSSPPTFEFSHSPPPSSQHVTKDELLSLLAAWKDVQRPTTPAPEPEDEPEPETTAAPPPPPPPEEDPEPEPEPEPPVPEVPAGPPPGVPVTVSLPALVPIQLAAMWQQPGPGAAVGGLGNLGLAGLGLGNGGVALNNLGGGGGGLGGAAAAGAAAAGGGAAAAGAAATARSGLGRSQARARIGGRAPAIRFPVANPRSFASGNYVAPRPRYYRDTDAMRFNVMASPPYQPYQTGQVQMVNAYWQ